jgi:3-oxoacid CoA-transferase subunit B
MPWTRDEMAARAARELQDGFYVEPRHRHPDAGGNHVPLGMTVQLSRRTDARPRPLPLRGEEDPDLINAGKQTITQLPTSSYFSSADSFGMIRGGTSTSRSSARSRSPRTATSRTG